jgi:murein L,D-transpeptidase YcbB/YkuD
MRLRVPASADRRSFLASVGALSAAGVLVGVTPARAARRRGPAALSSDEIDILLTALSDAERHGFRHGEFISDRLGRAIASRSFGTPAAEGELKSAIFAYARAQHGLRLTPSQFLADWSVRPGPYDPAPSFQAALASGGLQAWIDSLPPRYEGYQALCKSLALYRGYASAGGWKTIAYSDPLELGSKDPRVAQVRARLSITDAALAAAAMPADPQTFDADLQAAVQRFQRRNGLKDDGQVGEPTLDAMNQSPGQRILQIEANMERWRWLPRELPATRIQVNIAAAVLAVYRDGEPVLAMKAVAGRPTDQTPMLHANISSIVLNPPWHVPTSIATKEIWPKARKDKGYLARNQYHVIGGQLVQKAGPKSALGRFKFDFANTFGVYLHDTPVQSGFARTSRLASHGCVRLEQPKALAELLLQNDAAWPPDRIDQTIVTDHTVGVPLPERIPLYILYWTAFVDNENQTQFRADAYDWDRQLTTLLYPPKAAAAPAADMINPT